MPNETHDVDSSFSHFAGLDVFSLSTVYHGKYNTDLNTTAGVLYKPSTLPTPWPVLLVNFLLSLLVIVCGIFADLLTKPKGQPQIPSNNTESPLLERLPGRAVVHPVSLDIKQKSSRAFFSRLFSRLPSPGRFLSSFTHTSVFLLSVVRSWTAFISTCHAIHTSLNDPSSPARFHSATALIILLVSMAPDICDLPNHNTFIQLILITNGLFTFLAIEMNLWSELAHAPDYDTPTAYGYWYLTNSTTSCAFSVAGKCPTSFPQVGCGIWSAITNDVQAHQYSFGGVKSSPSINVGSGRAVSGEIWTAMVLTGGAIVPFFALGPAVYWFRLLYQLLQEGLCTVRLWLGFQVRQRQDTEQNYPYSRGEMLAIRLLCIGLVVFVGVICLPINVHQQTKTYSWWIVDSHGPLADFVPNSGSGAGFVNETTGSWSDCFEIKAPVDKYGFVRIWWDQVKWHPVDWLSFT